VVDIGARVEVGVRKIVGEPPKKRVKLWYFENVVSGSGQRAAGSNCEAPTAFSVASFRVRLSLDMVRGLDHKC